MAKRIYMYDYQVTRFNIATVVTAVFLALTVFFNSFPFLLGTYFIATIRKSFFNGLQDIETIRLARQVSRDNWGPVKCQFMESTLWVNKLPDRQRLFDEIHLIAVQRAAAGIQQQV